MNRRAAQLLSRGALRGLCKPLETGRSSLQSNMVKLRGGSSNVFAYSTAKPPQKVSSNAWRGTTSGRVAGVASKSTASEDASTADGVQAIEDTAQKYYDDSSSFNFHRQVWGDTIHMGRYDLLEGVDADLTGKARMQRASDLATDTLFSKAFRGDGPSPSDCIMMDMGSSVGNLARTTVTRYGCTVVCIDLSAAGNAENAERSAAAGLSEKIIIPGERSYFDTGVTASTMDIVVSQDSLGHASTQHFRAVKEAARVLKTGGIFVLTDLMRSDTADDAKLAEVYKQQKIAGLASVASYKSWGDEFGLEFIEHFDYSSNFATHYATVVEVIESMRGTMVGVDDHFIDWMLERYRAWVNAANTGLMTCGGLVFKKRAQE